MDNLSASFNKRHCLSLNSISCYLFEGLRCLRALTIWFRVYARLRCDSLDLNGHQRKKGIWLYQIQAFDLFYWRFVWRRVSFVFFLFKLVCFSWSCRWPSNSLLDIHFGLLFSSFANLAIGFPTCLFYFPAPLDEKWKQQNRISAQQTVKCLYQSSRWRPLSNVWTQKRCKHNNNKNEKSNIALIFLEGIELYCQCYCAHSCLFADCSGVSIHFRFNNNSAASE